MKLIEPCQQSCCHRQKELLYNKKHDCEYCPICDEWSYRRCGEENCQYCVGRPKKPSMATPIERKFGIYRSKIKNDKKSPPLKTAICYIVSETKDKALENFTRRVKFGQYNIPDGYFIIIKEEK